MGSSDRSAVDRSRASAHFGSTASAESRSLSTPSAARRAPAVISFCRRRIDPRSRPSSPIGGVVEQARQPAFFTECGVPDTLDGRFELICLHAFFYLHRLKAERPRRAGLCQRFFDAMFADLDRALREMGTGDLSVGKQVKRMAQGFYGRIRAYEEGLAADDSVLGAALARNLFGTVAGDGAARRGDGRLCPRAAARCAAADRRAARRPRFVRASATRDGSLAASSLTVETATPNSRGSCRSPGSAPEAFASRSRRPRGARRLAARFDLIALDRLDRRRSSCAARTAERSARGGFRGRVRAELRRHPRSGRGRGARQLLAALRPGPARPKPRSELDAEETAFEPLDGDAIDIGEAVAQEFSLALAALSARPRRDDRRGGDGGAAKEPFGALAAAGAIMRQRVSRRGTGRVERRHRCCRRRGFGLITAVLARCRRTRMLPWPFRKRKPRRRAATCAARIMR